MTWFETLMLAALIVPVALMFLVMATIVILTAIPEIRDQWREVKRSSRDA